MTDQNLDLISASQIVKAAIDRAEHAEWHVREMKSEVAVYKRERDAIIAELAKLSSDGGGSSYHATATRMVNHIYEKLNETFWNTGDGDDDPGPVKEQCIYWLTSALKHAATDKGGK